MTRIRISTTVDEQLLQEARQIVPNGTDAALIDSALGALVARHRKIDVDRSYSAYDQHPIDTEDAWGSLGAFRRNAGSS